MRAFIVLCLVAVACADKLGYNYHPVDHSSAGLSFTPGSGGSSSNFAPSYTGAGSNAGPSYTGAASNDAPSFGGQGGQAGDGGVDKEFYSFSANEEDFYEPAASNQYGGDNKQSLRVIFIKGPENNGLEDAALALARQAAARKTAIYVLNKQHDLDDFANKLNNANSNQNNKPEVHFVKYRTPEDAANAQRAIQGQYDSLGGPSRNIEGGQASTLNFASQAPAQASHGGAPGSQGGFGAASGPSSQYLAPAAGGLSQTYLPSSFLRRFRTLRTYRH